MIIVTGGAGFIGSNLIQGLNSQGVSDILVVDDLTMGQKCHNLTDLNFMDYMDKDEFLRQFLIKGTFPVVEAVFHEGACSDTTEWDGRYLMDVNYTYSKLLLHECLRREIPFLYASSASVYGNGPIFIESREHEKPLNMYAFSKFQFDQHVRSLGKTKSQVVGLRYFNVYGPREGHKGKMASVAFHFNSQLSQGRAIRLFDGNDGYGAGNQMRDFIHVDDVVSINLWLLANPSVSGIFNAGTGCAETFNDVARTILSFYGHGEIEYIPFPDNLKGAYQSYTQADMTKLREKGYDFSFMPVCVGVAKYMNCISTKTGVTI